MGKRGKIPASIEEKLEKGDAGHSGKKKLAAKLASTTSNAPKMDVTIPLPPDWLSLDAKEIWSRLAPELVSMGVLGAVDIDLLGKYCASTAQAIACEWTIVEKGLLITHPNGTISGRPELKIAKEAWKEARALAPLLGITYSARQRLGIQVADTTASTTESAQKPAADDPYYDDVNCLIAGLSLEEYRRQRGRA